MAKLTSRQGSALANDPNPTLSGDLDVNGHAIDFPTTDVTDVLNENDLVSNSETKLATQASIKSYVDSQSGGGGSSDVPISLEYNKYVNAGVYTYSRSITMESRNIFIALTSGTELLVADYRPNGLGQQRHDYTADIPNAFSSMTGAAHIGDYIYLLTAVSGTTLQLWRFNLSDISTGAVQMTGVTFGTIYNLTWLLCDGTHLYVGNDGATLSNNRHKFRKYSISGTTLTQVGSTITCGSSANNFVTASMDNRGYFYGYDAAEKCHRFDPTGANEVVDMTNNNPLTQSTCSYSVEGEVYLNYSKTNAKFTLNTIRSPKP
jgi:hypothetical protein